jgi:hypothetical protein
MVREGASQGEAAELKGRRYDHRGRLLGLGRLTRTISAAIRA